MSISSKARARRTNRLNKFLPHLLSAFKIIFSLTVSDLVHSFINGYTTFLIAPDGSKEGWDESNEGDKLRDLFVDYINSQAYEDGSSSLKYAELFYGEDNGKSKIVRHN